MSTTLRPLPASALTKATRFLRALPLVLAAAQLIVSVPAAAQQRTISNTAHIEWDSAGGRASLASNRVDIVIGGTPPTTSALGTFRLAGAGAGTPVSLAGIVCHGSAGDVPFALEGLWAGTAAGAAPIAPASAIRPGEPLVLQVSRPAADRDPAQIDHLRVELVTAEGDRETLTLVETAAGSGLFSGAILTVAMPPAPVSGDCRLSVQRDEPLALDATAGGEPVGSSEIPVVPGRSGTVFDSISGTPIRNTRVTLVDVDTGTEAKVYGDDGVSRFPATVVTGQSVRDTGGRRYEFGPGGYRFPLVAPGRYRLRVELPPPYTALSSRDAEELAAVRGPDGGAFTLTDASFGTAFALPDVASVEFDMPADAVRTALALAKDASRASAAPGEIVRFQVTVRNRDPHLATGRIRITDTLPSALRLRRDSLRVGGAPVAEAEIAPDGHRFTLTLPSLDAGEAHALSYAAEVRSDAQAGDVVNRVEAVDASGTPSNVAEATVRIERETIGRRMTVIGRVVDGGCASDPGAARGVAGVRVMLEDGSYAVTDIEGRYHFEGLTPGTHVVQLDGATLPADRAVADCGADTRSAGRAFSRFVEGQGGALKRVDFRLAETAPRAIAAAKTMEPAATLSDSAAAGADRDWLAGQEPGLGWLFPEADHNPRAPAVRVAIKHMPGQKVALFVGGRPVDPVAYDGARKNAAGTVAVSLWRGIPVETGATRLTAEIRNADGTLAGSFERIVRYGANPIRAELVRDRSLLVADGVSRPVLAVRFTDRDGRPVRHGLTGAFELPAPYYPASEADAQQARQLAGLERARPFWRVEGDDGIAYIALEPTTASGTVSLRFDFRDGEASRAQRLEAWLDPGERPWTIVGLAEGTVGYNRLDSRLEKLGAEQDELLTDGRLALYAKGRIAGRWLMTLAYDSDKQADETRFGGVIDPDAYYTVYADRSERRYDAASVRKLYLKLERPQFYALFGDYETGIDEPELARYVRAFNGVKAEYRSERVAAVAFAADSPNRHRRDELQGNGLSGPYALGARGILPNSERVAIEVRDRLRSDRIVERRLLTRHIDYDIDYQSGILRFREPILSRSAGLDPQFIVADYEVDGVASRTLNAGGRASWRSADEKLQVAATAIHDADAQRSTDLVGADVRYRPSPATEIRAEIAVSDGDAKAGAPAAAGTATAWQIEAEHHGGRYDLLAYARERESGFGLGQTNAVENGTRKFGFDARARFGDAWSVTASAWHEDYLAGDARRIAARILGEYRGRDLSARAGFTLADDRLADGREARSTLFQLGATRRFLSNRLELDAQTEIPLGGEDESIDFPARHRLSARYAVTSDVQLVGTYEIADGEHIDARTARIGFDLKPWAGARIALSGNVQDIAEYGPRSFAAFGLSQSLVLDEHWSVDLSLDSNRTLSGIDPARVLNPLHPVASGGFLGAGGLTEDFTAVTAGATYRAERWTATARAEYRAGEHGDRYGVTAAALRQIGEGSAAGGALNRFVAKGENGAETRTTNLQLSWAHRPADSRWSFLEKLELRDDAVSGAVAGLPGPIGIPLAITGDARSRRMVNALSINFSADGGFEGSLFWGARYVSDRLGDEDIGGWSNAVGADLRFDLGETLDIGVAGTVRHGLGARAVAWSGGPSVGFTPFENGWLSLGWNVVGFHDRDFSESRYTRSGPYVTMRIKFDQMSLQGLGLGRP